MGRKLQSGQSYPPRLSERDKYPELSREEAEKEIEKW